MTRFVDIGPMLQEMDMLSRKADKARVKFFSKVKTWNLMRKFFHEDRAPAGLDVQ